MDRRRITSSIRIGSAKIMKMPFGKHIGKEIHTVPQDYLRWFKNNITNLHGDLLKAVEAALEGKPFQPPTIKERVDDARQRMLVLLRSREMVC